MGCASSATISIRDFSLSGDSVWLHELWHRALHSRWAIPRQAMLNILSAADLLLVADCDGVQSAICAIDSRHEGAAALLLLLVEPTRQQRGIGSELMRVAEDMLNAQGARRLTVGAGDHGYFWPGVPNEQVSGWRFFTRRGFEEQESSQDLIQRLVTFETPAWVSARQLATATTLFLGEASRAAQIKAFERRYFPAWASYFENEMQEGGYKNILFAQGSDQSIVGTVLLKQDASIPWQEMHRTQIGTLNTLGVAPEKQGQGIGLALAAGAMEHLRERGCSSCYIQWTGLVDWYGKLGAKSWARYHMASKLL